MKTRFFTFPVLIAPVIWHAGPGQAQPSTPPAIASQLHAATGSARIEPLLMTLKLPQGLGYLDTPQTKRLFTEFYGNPESDVNNTFGCVLPVPLRPGVKGSYEVTIGSISGRIGDTGPGSSLNPETIKKAFLTRIAAINDSRPRGQATFEEPDIVVPARYDRTRHVLIVGKSFRWSDEAEPSVNLDAFLLTRNGAVILTSTSRLKYLQAVSDGLNETIDAAHFDALDAYEAGKSEPAGPHTLDEIAANLGG